MKKITIIAIVIILGTTLASFIKDSKRDYDSKSKLCVIKKVELIKMPSLNPNGHPWDINSGPDVYFIISSQGNQLFKSGVKYDLDISSLPVYFANDLPFTLPYLNQVYTVTFWEYENNTLLKKDKAIKNGSFNPKDFLNKPWVLFGDKTDFSFKIYMAWE